MNKIIPVILCGGNGSRLPSIPPKQFQPLTGNTPMIVETIKRCKHHAFDKPIITGSENYKDTTKSILNDYNIKTLGELYEPSRQNTAAAIITASLYIFDNFGNKPVVFLPCDHDINSIEIFQKTIQKITLGQISCFGIKPDYAEINYGYIQINEDDLITKFHEKPNLETAIKYLISKNIFWNMGVFASHPNTIISEAKKHCNDILSLCRTALNGSNISPDTYAQLPSIPFDKAIMEKTNKAIMVKYHGDWQDIACQQQKTG